MSNFLQLFPQARLGNNLIDFSLQANEFAKSPPSLSVQERDRVNQLFEPLLDHEISRNISRLADETVASHLQAAGSAVYAIGQVLSRGEHGPLVPATLARTVLENCAVVIFLCAAQDHISRTGRAINIFHLGLLNAKAGSPKSPWNPMFQATERLKQRMGSIGVQKSDNLPSNYTQLVSANLQEIEAGSLYENLSRFVHHNMISHASVMASADHGTLHNYVDIYDFSVRAGAALACAIDAAKSFKSAYPDSLDVTRQEAVQRFGDFYIYCTEMQSSTPGGTLKISFCKN